MAHKYEYAPEESGLDAQRPKAPEFWVHRINRICKLMPDEPTWVNDNSVVMDPETKEFAIDSNAFLCYYDQDTPFAAKSIPIGLMRTWFMDGDKPVDGFIVDLRYAYDIKQRPDVNFEPGEDNPNMTVPPIGVLLRDGDVIHVSSPYRRLPAFMHAAEMMMQHFDEDYATYKDSKAVPGAEVGQLVEAQDPASRDGQ